ncbi:DUF932 domain-containing protein [Tolumonas auensis]|uniref:DUF932 domain-containing protein n=1 Tax=Tolumonas auensis TaxID=43948 RepID=UPI002AA87974|nr:DUF932 domain-containing protein [Tolumonas auensis]
MAHEISSMAYAGETPWHGLGNHLSEHQPINIWLKEAGMDWTIEQSDVLFNADRSALHIRSYADSKVLFRSDSLTPLSVVSNRYKVVQPHEVLNFYKDLVSVGGFELETAGVLKGGKKLWALAKTGQEAKIKGNDRIKAYLLLATSCDGTLCTTAQFTSVRVVCNNTLQMATRDSTGAVKVPHSTKFDPAQVKEALGIGFANWDAFMTNLKQLSQRTVSPEEADGFIRTVLNEPEFTDDNVLGSKIFQKVSSLYLGEGMGAELSSASGTAWGLVNAMTEYVDHHRRARNQDNRLDSAWFGQGALLKQKAFNQALTLLH